MARIRGGTFQAHHEQIWTDLTNAMGDLVAERGFEGFTLAHVASRAGIARNTIYNYAKDKTALAAKVAQRASRDVLERVEQISRESAPAPHRLTEIAAVLMDAFETPSVRLMLVSPTHALPQDVLEHPEGPFTRVGEAVEKVVAEGVAEGSFRVQGGVALTTQLLSGIVRAGAEQIARHGADTDEVLQAVQRLLLSALSAR